MQQERQWQYFLVAFLDILGQRQEFEGINRLPRTPEEIERLKQADIRTAGFLHVLRDAFKTYFEGFCAPSNLASGLPADKRALFESMTKTEITFRSFSDLFLAEVSLRTESNTPNVLRGIGGVLMAAGGMCLISFQAQHALRGSVEVSLGTRLGTGEVYGPVLNRAYQLESAVAQYPRIVVGQGLIEYLLIQRDLTGEDIVQKCCKSLASMCLDMIVEDRDGIPIIDYVGPKFRGIFSRTTRPGAEPLNFDEMVTKALAFVRSEKDRWFAAGRVQLYQRYSLAEDYILSRSPELRSS